MTLTVESEFSTEEQDGGGEVTRRSFKFRPAEKDRDGRSNRPRRLAVTSERDAAGPLQVDARRRRRTHRRRGALTRRPRW
jgi:hypothetical protein